LFRAGPSPGPAPAAESLVAAVDMRARVVGSLDIWVVWRAMRVRDKELNMRFETLLS
jgi:hypothetical protein